MIYVIVTVELQPGRTDDFLAEFNQVVPLVQAELGCLEYGPTIDIETTLENRAPPRSNVVTIIEKWESLESLEKHLIAPHMLAYRPKVKNFVKQATARILSPPTDEP